MRENIVVNWMSFQINLNNHPSHQKLIKLMTLINWDQQFFRIKSNPSALRIFYKGSPAGMIHLQATQAHRKRDLWPSGVSSSTIPRTAVDVSGEINEFQSKSDLMARTGSKIPTETSTTDSKWPQRIALTRSFSLSCAKRSTLMTMTHLR